MPSGAIRTQPWVLSLFFDCENAGMLSWSVVRLIGCDVWTVAKSGVEEEEREQGE
jgi:hypothetical protein